MNMHVKARTGGQILVDQLIAQGVDRLSCVPGESYLAVLDALVGKNIDVVVCRQEGGAAIMAEAYGKMTGRPGICFVTRGPGATNGSHGVHIAMQDSTPMIMFVGQVERGMIGREAFQELDYKAVFGSMAKWVVEVDSAARIPELVARAFRVAMQGRPGPVVIALPEDTLTEMAEVADAHLVTPAATEPRGEDLVKMVELLRDAKRPAVILGGSRWTNDACKQMVAFAETMGLPVITSFRRGGLFPADHPQYAGDCGVGVNPKLAAFIKETDVLLLVGARMSEMPSQSYTLLDIPNPKQRVIHVHPGDGELGRVYQPEIAIQASPDSFAARLADMKLQKIDRKAYIAAANEVYLEWSGNPKPIPGKFQYGEVVAALSRTLPVDATITVGAGNYTGWVHRYYRFRLPGMMLGPTSGSMGYSVPAAVMAKRMRPKSTVVAFAGDGCFLMNGQEFATAVQYDIPVIICVIDNGMYGTIRMHQERDYPTRISATELKNPDFAAMARAFGGHGERVETTEEFEPAFKRAQASGKPAIIHCFLDQQAITTGTTIDALRKLKAKT